MDRLYSYPVFAQIELPVIGRAYHSSRFLSPTPNPAHREYCHVITPSWPGLPYSDWLPSVPPVQLRASAVA